MSDMRKRWSNLKAEAKKAGYDVEKDVGSQKVGKLLDKLADAEDAYDKGIAKFAFAPDEAKEKALKKAVVDAIAAAHAGFTAYSTLVDHTQKLIPSGRSGLDANQQVAFNGFATGLFQLIAEVEGLKLQYKRPG